MSDATPKARLVRLSHRGQITIPFEFRQHLGIVEGTMLRVTLNDQDLRISPVRVVETGCGSPWLRDLYDAFAPVRQEILERQIPEAEINTDIDAAINAVRAERSAKPS